MHCRAWAPTVGCGGPGRALGNHGIRRIITFKLLDIADLTVDGSLPWGGCVCAMLILNKSMNPVAVFLRNRWRNGGGLAVWTGILHTVFEIPSILAGILTQISLWSINLWIMGEAATFPLQVQVHCDHGFFRHGL